MNENYNTFYLTELENERIDPFYEKNNIAVCFFSSNFYALYCGVAINSLIFHNDHEFNYDIIIFEQNITNDNKRIFLEMVKYHSNISIRFINIKNLIEDFTISVHGHFSIEGCLKIFLMSNAFKNYSKFLAFDSDLVFETDIKDLFAVDISEHYMAAVEDVIMKNLLKKQQISGGANPLVPKIPCDLYISDYLDLGSTASYFNTGVVLLNLELCRKNDFFNQCINLLNEKAFWFVEQDALNEILGNKILPLDYVWNFLAVDDTLVENLEELGGDFCDLYYNRVRKPNIIHFCGNSKPWFNPFVIYSDKFYYYSHDTAWHEKIMFRSLDTKINVLDKNSTSIKKNLETINKKLVKRNNIFQKAKKSKYYLTILTISKRRQDLQLIDARKRMISNNYKLSKNKKNYNKLRSIKDKHKGQKCYIIGNGPSLSVNDLDLLKNEITFGLNSIDKIYDKTSWRPNYYVNNDIMLDYKMAINLETRKNDLFRFLKQDTQYDGLFLSTSTFNDEILKINENVTFLPTVDYLYLLTQNQFPSFSECCDKKIYAFGTTIYLIVQLAVYMGFTEINLLGVDCDYSGIQQHFYELDETDEFFSKKGVFLQNNTKSLLRGFHAILYHMRKSKSFSVYNVGRGGKLELFPRMSLERSLLEESSLPVSSIKNETTMNIGYCSTSKYAPLMSVSIESFLHSHQNIPEINLFIFDLGLDETDIIKIKKQAEKYKRNLEIVLCKDKLDELVKDLTLSPFGGTSYTYCKIFSFLFLDIDKILILDSDTVINQCLIDMYSIELNDYIGAAVPELSAYYLSSEDKNIIYKNNFYYNTGVLLLNVKKMQNSNILDEFNNVVGNYGRNLRLADQSLFNLLETDQIIYPLNVKYNYNINLSIPKFSKVIYPTLFYYEKFNLGVPFSKGYGVKQKDIAIIHYVGEFKPWIKYKFSKFSKIYHKYRKRTEWRKEKYISSHIDELCQKKYGTKRPLRFYLRYKQFFVSFMDRYMPQLLISLKKWREL